MAKRRMARGAFGGSLARSQQGLQVQIEVPVVEGLDFDQEAFYRATGQRVATEVRSSLRAGEEYASGAALPQPQPGKGVGSPLNRTGALIASIKYRGGWVHPSTNTRRDVSKRARSNFGLMAIHLSGIYWRRYADLTTSGRKAMAKGRATFRPRATIDPMGTLSPNLPDKVQAAANSAFRKLVVKLRGTSEPLDGATTRRRR